MDYETLIQNFSTKFKVSKDTITRYVDTYLAAQSDTSLKEMDPNLLDKIYDELWAEAQNVDIVQEPQEVNKEEELDKIVQALKKSYESLALKLAQEFQEREDAMLHTEAFNKQRIVDLEAQLAVKDVALKSVTSELKGVAQTNGGLSQQLRDSLAAQQALTKKLDGLNRDVSEYQLDNSTLHDKIRRQEKLYSELDIKYQEVLLTPLPQASPTPQDIESAKIIETLRKENDLLRRDIRDMQPENTDETLSAQGSSSSLAEELKEADNIPTTEPEPAPEPKPHVTQMYKANLAEIKDTSANISFSEFKKQFESKFKSTNSTGLKDMIKYMNSLDKDTNMNEKIKFEKLGVKMHEIAISRKDSWWSNSAIIGKGRSADATTVYKIMADKNFSLVGGKDLEKLHKASAPAGEEVRDNPTKFIR
jgi:hypothetical protein